MSFDIKLTKQSFENVYSIGRLCRAIQHAFSKPSLVNLISKGTDLIFSFIEKLPKLNNLVRPGNAMWVNKKLPAYAIISLNVIFEVHQCMIQWSCDAPLPHTLLDLGKI